MLSTQVSQMVLSAHLNFLQFIYNCMSYNFRNLISPRVQCTKTTNRYISSFDRFTDYYNRMSKNFKKLLSPWVQCTSITNRVLSSIDRFNGLLQLYEKKVQKFHNFTSKFHIWLRTKKNFKNSLIRDFTKSHQSCFQLIWPFYGFLQLYEKKVQKFHNSVC